jgi:hypothetical protein
MNGFSFNFIHWRELLFERHNDYYQPNPLVKSHQDHYLEKAHDFTPCIKSDIYNEIV